MPPRRPPAPPQTALCRHCHRELEWGNILRFDREIRPRVFERAYACPHCRAILEFASWQTGISRKD